jgi:hypothetical protein
VCEGGESKGECVWERAKEQWRCQATKQLTVREGEEATSDGKLQITKWQRWLDLTVVEAVAPSLL